MTTRDFTFIDDMRRGPLTVASLRCRAGGEVC